MTKFTENQKETYSLAYIKQQFAKCDKLDTSYLKTGDKEPSWDGDLYLHKTNKLKAEDVIRIPVQIKGTEKFDTKTMKFRVERHHLVNYKRDNGVFFMVVQVNSDTDLEFYYCDLLSPDLDQLLAKNKGKYAYLKMKPFDTSDTEKIERILLKFAEARKHLSSNDIYIENPYLFDEVILNIDLKSRNLNDFLFDEQIVYGKMNNLPNKLIPIIKGTIEKIDEEVNQPVSVNNKIYFDSFKRTFSKESVILSIGNALSIIIKNIPGTDVNHEVTFNIDLKLNRSFYELYEDSKFIEALINIGGFEIEYQFLPIPIHDTETTGVMTNIKTINDIKHLFNILKISKDFDFSNLSDIEVDLFQRLIDYFVHNNHKSLDFKQNGLWSIKLSNLALKFLVFDYDAIDGPRIVDFFNTEVKYTGSYIIENTSEVSCSYFLSFKATDLIELCNIDYDRIKSEIFIIEPIEWSYITLMITFSLEVLNAFDNSNLPEHKDLFESILEYLKSISTLTDQDKDIISVNEYQYKKRLNTLDSLDQKNLFRLESKYENLDSDLKKNEMLFAINVLIENYEEASKYFEMLEEKIKENFRNYPIFKLYKEPTTVV